MAHGGGYFKTTYASDLALVDTRLRRTALAALIVALLVLPRLTSPFVLDLVAQTALAAVGALALNLLTGLAGQISLGHAGFIAAGAFTTAVLVEHRLPSPLLALPAAALVGAVLGVVVGIPALRLKGLYLALGTLALHQDRKSTRLNSSHGYISYAVFCLKKKNQNTKLRQRLTSNGGEELP